MRWREGSNMGRVELSCGVKKVAELRCKATAVTPKLVLLITDLYFGVPSNYLGCVVKFSQTSPRDELYIYI